MKGTLLSVRFVSLLLFAASTACGPQSPAAPSEAQSVTILDTYYVRFHVDGESYHAVPIDGDDLLGGARGGYLFGGPVYVRKEGDELWQCHPQGYQIPQGARIMVSSSRAPVTIKAMEGACR